MEQVTYCPLQERPVGSWQHLLFLETASTTFSPKILRRMAASLSLCDLSIQMVALVLALLEPVPCSGSERLPAHGRMASLSEGCSFGPQVHAGFQVFPNLVCIPVTASNLPSPLSSTWWLRDIKKLGRLSLFTFTVCHLVTYTCVCGPCSEGSRRPVFSVPASKCSQALFSLLLGCLFSLKEGTVC